MVAMDHRLSRGGACAWLWPEARDMEQKEQARSLDAVGILKSGQVGICTANANLACALLRVKQIPCRSIAAIPPISRRLEMHRIVEYVEALKRN